MILTNPWFVVALLGTFLLYQLEVLATMLNLSALTPKVPRILRDAVTQEGHERSLEYARTSALFDMAQETVNLVLFVGFWLGGGFALLDIYLGRLGLSPLWQGMLTVGLLLVVQQIIQLPFDLYDTFVIEQRFGFNKMTLGTFIGDRVKGFILMVVLGGPLLCLVLWMFGKFEWAALFAWLVMSAFSLIMSWLAPRLILPLFFKFQPLPDPALKEAILKLSEQVQFPVADVSMVDGSRRSTKANAFFTGFGATKRIALFDTLLEHSQPEILAVLAHEVGHCKRRHVPKQMILSLLVSGFMFLLLHFGMLDDRLGEAFGVAHASVAWKLIFFGVIYQPVSTLLGLINGHLSRKYEFEADAFARDTMGGPESMSAALMRLSKDHLSNPTPHPFYVFLHYSHPPILQRLAALQSS